MNLRLLWKHQISGISMISPITGMTTKEVKFRASLKKEPKYVALEESIAKKALAVAKKKHVSIETLVNLWLKEKLSTVR